MLIHALLSLSDYNTNMKIEPPNTKFYTNSINFSWDWVFRVIIRVNDIKMRLSANSL